MLPEEEPKVKAEGLEVDSAQATFASGRQALLPLCKARIFQARMIEPACHVVRPPVDLLCWLLFYGMEAEQ